MNNLKKASFVLATCLMTTGATLSAACGAPTPVVTKEAPAAIGPYSQAVCAGSYLFVSGQIALDPVTGKLSGDTIEAQTTQALKNLEAILKAKGLTFENVVKVDVYMKDLSQFAAMNKIYGEKFVYATKPARATVQANLPKDAMVEIACIAFIPNAQ